MSAPSRSFRFFALGGLGEIGMNCLALEQDGQIVLVDCGVTFDDPTFGVDVVHPLFAALEGGHGRLVAVVLTHGHEDHIGALPYLLARHDVPVYGPPYALELVREKGREHEVLSYAELVPLPVGEPTQVGPFAITPVRVTHSIPDATALAIGTAAGVVVHSGDFKIDPDPPDGEHFDAATFERLGDEGVALLFSDSTNADADGYAGAERSVGDALLEIAAAASGAVVVGLFASNVARLELLGEVARRTKRKIVLFGRSVGLHARAGRATGYLAWPSDLVWPDDRLGELPRQSILGIATGTQGEERAALSRMAYGDHPTFKVHAGDTFALSSRVIPGHERAVFDLVARLTERGAHVLLRHNRRDIHVSGHAHRDEQRRLLELIRPRAFVPVHGTRHHLERHAALGRELGVPDVRVTMNGEWMELAADGRLEKVGAVPFGVVRTWAKKAVAEDTVRERRAIAERGALTVALDGTRVALVTGFGLAAAEAQPSLLRAIHEEVEAALREAGDGSAEGRRELARVTARRVVFRAIGHKPLTKVELL